MQRLARFGAMAVLLACALAGATVVVADSPPGLSAEGVTDAEALLDAHEATLDNTSYTYEYRYVRRTPNGTLVERLRTLAQVAANDTFNATHVEDGAGSTTPDTDTYANESVVYTAIHQNGNVSYARASPSKRAPARQRFLSTGLVEQLLNSTDVAVERVERNGTAVYEIETPSPSATTVGTYELTNVSLEAVVAESGVVREFHATYQREGDHVVVRRSYSDIGTTEVAQPAWLPAAIDDATRETRTIVEYPLLVVLGYGGFLVGGGMVVGGGLVGARRLQYTGVTMFLVGLLAVALLS